MPEPEYGSAGSLPPWGAHPSSVPQDTASSRCSQPLDDNKHLKKYYIRSFKRFKIRLRNAWPEGAELEQYHPHLT